MRPRMQTITMTTCPPLPRVIAYKPTNGCGASSAYSVFRSGVQNKNRMTSGKPINPDATVEEKMPRAAVRLAFFVSSLIWPGASNPTRIPAVTKYESIQFQGPGAPVSLYVCVKTNFADWNPYVLETEMGSQIMLSRKSNRMIPVASAKIVL